MTANDQVPAPFGPYPSAYVDEMFEKAFGEPARHSEEDRRVISFVEEHLKSRHTTAFPPPHRFLVEHRGGLWVVTVMSLEALGKNGFRAPGLELFIREGKKGFVVEKTAIRT